MNMATLKVLHLITTLPRLSGAADNTRYTVNLLDRDRYDVHLACGPAEFDGSRLSPQVAVTVIESLVRPVELTADLQAFRSICRLLRRNRYDIVHTHNAKAGVLGRLAATVTGIPIVVHTAHSISFAASSSSVTNSLYWLADWACAPLCEKIITVSSLNTDRYLKACIGRPDQYVTIYSGVEISKYLDRSQRDMCRSELGIADGATLVAWIGRLNRQKDPVTFVRAAKLLAARFPAMQFVIVGDDPVGQSLEDEVRTVVRSLSLVSKVRLLGYRPDVYRILAAADLVMHTSLYEGLGRSVIEAMLAGTPLVATAVDGVREAVISGDRGGLLVPSRNPEALAEAATRLVTDREFAARLAETGRTWARRHFDVLDMVTAIDDLYQTLWHSHARRRG